MTTTAIKDTLNDSQPIPVTIEKILNEVARTYNVMPSDIRGKKRNANVSAARQMTMYIIREVTGMSMEPSGRSSSAIIPRWCIPSKRWRKTSSAIST